MIAAKALGIVEKSISSKYSSNEDKVLKVKINSNDVTKMMKRAPPLNKG